MFLWKSPGRYGNGRLVNRDIKIILFLIIYRPLLPKTIRIRIGWSFPNHLDNKRVIYWEVDMFLLLEEYCAYHIIRILGLWENYYISTFLCAFEVIVLQGVLSY